ncbi:hypothetical protein LTR86_010179 [Recurvomyces mirabilis]|nr:hypothetical protein LTR86_010179 [Recurvomyces mirabilis]
MVEQPNKSVIFKKIPEGTPAKGEHLVLEDRPLDLDASPPEGGLVVRNLYFSFDPYQRGRMRDVKSESYSPAYPLGEPIRNSMICKVISSGTEKFGKDDLITNYMSGPLQEYTILEKHDLGENVWKLENKHDLDPALFLGPLGMTGLTAYSSFYEIGQPKKGETIFISAASGAVGSLVGQLAKREGLKVIGSVGSDEKLDYILQDLGFDAGFNYKKEDPMDALPHLAPDGIDIYFENVGGRHLEAAISSFRLFGRTVVCGMIGDYNKPFEKKYGVKNLQVIFEKRLSLRGFIVADFQDKYYAEHQKNCQAWLVDGSLKGKLHKTAGIDNAIDGLLELFDGKNFGKAVLQIDTSQ